MEKVLIPESLVSSIEQKKQAGILYHPYESQHESSRVKVSLNSNLFSFILEGKKQVILRETCAVVDDSRFLLLKAGNCLMTEQLSEGKNYRSLLVFFENESLEEFALEHGDIGKRKTTSPEFLILQKDPFIQHYVESLLLLLDQEIPLSPKLQQVKFEELFLYLTERYGTEVLDYFLVNKLPQHELDFRKVISQNQDNKLTVGELAFLCNMSTSTFKRKFAEHYHSSPSKWFQEKRLEQAAYMLRVQKMKPSEIYFEVGFSNLSSFSQSFKNRYGSSPGKYAQRPD